jgi:hypothetical protein
MVIPPTYSSARLALLYAIVLLFVAAAVYDLVNARSMPLSAILASIAWLSLMALVLTASVRGPGGIRQYVINRFGEFSKQQFVKADRKGSEPVTLCFGYDMFGCEFYYLELDAASVVSVEWHPGQATAKVGRDMNDWCVSLWYRHPDGPQLPPYPGVRDEVVYIVGPSGRKGVIEAFGRSFVAFLRDMGVELASGACSTEFRVTGHPTTSPPR